VRRLDSLDIPVTDGDVVTAFSVIDGGIRHRISPCQVGRRRKLYRRGLSAKAVKELELEIET